MYLIHSRIIAVLLLFYINQSHSSNWAQSSGYLEQNVAIPSIPSPAVKHWQARYGMSSILFPNVSTPNGNIVIFGGDTHSNNMDQLNSMPGVIDTTWYHGFKNDVWSTEGTIWSVKGDIRLRGRTDQKIPNIKSQLKWKLLTTGLLPPPHMNYDDWIFCQSYFNKPRYTIRRQQICAFADVSLLQVQWSPRRHHNSVYFQNYMWVMGGRAREFKEYSEERTVGGIIGPRIDDIPRTPNNRNQKYTTLREASVYKNDVWKSKDGIHWKLVTPGCKVSQRSLIARGNAQSNLYGEKSQICQDDTDCYGEETCDSIYKTCVCKMWSPREQFGLTAYGNYIYISGGYTSTLISDVTSCGDRPCGDTDASSYRYYLNDVWRSSNGLTWELLTETAFQNGGRGGHQMLAIESLTNNKGYLWVLGGRGSEASNISSITLYNDIWISQINSQTGMISNFTSLTEASQQNISLPWSLDHIPWKPRVGHKVVLETSSPSNYYTRMLYVIGGSDGSGGDGYGLSTGSFLNDIWSWRLDLSGQGESWCQDYTPSELYLTSGQTFTNNTPTMYYVTPDSDLKYLKQWWTPDRLHRTDRSSLVEIPFISNAHIQMMNKLGLHTIRDLAKADRYTILRLRGYDIPQVKERMNFTTVCDARALAIAVVKKCSVDYNRHVYEGQQQLPWNVKNIFGGDIPDSQDIQWHGFSSYSNSKSLSSDPKALIATWDGCSYINVSSDPVMAIHGPNVPGIGYVVIPSKVKSPDTDIDNLFCSWNPGSRAYHGAEWFEERLYVFGGKSDETNFYADTWYREPVLPKAYTYIPLLLHTFYNKDDHIYSCMPFAVFTKTPRQGTSDHKFEFTVDKPGCYYEYRLWDPLRYKILTPWTPVMRKADVAWLDWRKKGPGDGWYTLYVRAVDPAGNRDVNYIIGQNVYNWKYVSPTPWDIIFGSIGGFIGLLLIIFIEYRRRLRKAAMERYALKRMRRKFKAMQKDIDGQDLDWRKVYLDNKEKELNKNPDLMTQNQLDEMRAKEEKLLKLDNERKKRENEKEKIRNKLRNSRVDKEADYRNSRVSMMNSRVSVDSTRPRQRSNTRNTIKSNFIPSDSDEDEDDDGGIIKTSNNKNNPHKKSVTQSFFQRTTGGGGNRIVPYVSDPESSADELDESNNKKYK